MRVAFFLEGFPRLSETFILSQITGLIDRGLDVDIFASRPALKTPSHPEVGAVPAYAAERTIERSHLTADSGASCPL